MNRQRWQRKRVQVSHSDDWLMTYADVITLLLCFFAITIVTSVNKKEVKPEITPPPVQQIVVEETKPLPLQTVAPQIIAGATILPEDMPYRDDQSDEPPATIAAATPEPAAAPVPAEVLPAPVVVADPAPVQPPAALSAIAADSAGKAKLEQKGDRITAMELDSAAFFGSGSATLNKGGIDILHKVAAELKGDQYKGYRITVEGHTDDTPIHTAQFPSNWELSTGRAAAVVRYLLEQGIAADNLRAAGYADTFPKAPNRDANGHPIPANQAENRRVVIRLEKIDKGE